MSIKLNKWSGFLLFLPFASLLACNNQEEKLPILGRREAITKIVDGKEVIDTVYQTIQPFKFLNQDIQWVSNDTFKAKLLQTRSTWPISFLPPALPSALL